MQQEEVKEIPLIYPLISVTFKTVTVVDGRPIQNECEEVFDARDHEGKKILHLFREFKGYVKKVQATVKSQQARDALQNILDNHSPAVSQILTSLPSELEALKEAAQGNTPSDPSVE